MEWIIDNMAQTIMICESVIDAASHESSPFGLESAAVKAHNVAMKNLVVPSPSNLIKYCSDEMRRSSLPPSSPC
jgi:hypothetical protein